MKQHHKAEPSAADFYAISRDLQNRSNKRIGVKLSKNAQIHSYFGCNAKVALICWEMLISFALLPGEGQILHPLWALFFMKVYPSENVACATAGGSLGAIDPKTLWKYGWPIIEAMANLEPFVLSKLCFVH